MFYGYYEMHSRKTTTTPKSPIRYPYPRPIPTTIIYDFFWKYNVNYVNFIDIRLFISYYYLIQTILNKKLLYSKCFFKYSTIEKKKQNKFFISLLNNIYYF